MFPLLLLVVLFAFGSASDANEKMNEVLGLVDREAKASYPLKDIDWKYSAKLFKFIPVSASFSAKGIRFWDATTAARLSDVTESRVSDQVRLEVQLTLATMAINYGHFELKLPLLGTLAGSGTFDLAVNSFGISAYYGDDCNRTRVYVWPPRGDPRLKIYSTWFISRLFESLFNFFGSGLIEDILDYNIVGSSLDIALREPLTKAISKVFCEKN